MTCLMSFDGAVPAAMTIVSNSIDLAVARVRSTTWAFAPSPSTPPTGAITSTVAPSFSAARRSLAIPARSEPASAMTPILRPAIGPGSVMTWDSAGERATSSAGVPFGAGRPSPAATCSHRSASMLASAWSWRSRIGCS